MGNNVFSQLFSSKRSKFLMVGLDAAGKTTILYKLKLGEVFMEIPTIGINLEFIRTKELEIVCYDVGGSDRIKCLYHPFTQGINGLIFVVNSMEIDRHSRAALELKAILQEKNVDNENLPILVFANHQDREGAKTVAEIEEVLCLKDLNRRYFVQASCAVDESGLVEGFTWLSNAVSSN